MPLIVVLLVAAIPPTPHWNFSKTNQVRKHPPTVDLTFVSEAMVEQFILTLTHSAVALICRILHSLKQPSKAGDGLYEV